MKDTTFLRFLAISLIVNSHLDPFYPTQKFATGGMLGNSIFFMLSSYGLYLSERKRQRNLTDWYARRIKRIYPSVWATIILIILPYTFYHQGVELKETLSYFNMFFYPPFWFLKAIMVYYFFQYFMIKEEGNNRAQTMALLASFLYIYYYFTLLDLQQFSITEFPFRLIFYFLIVIYGVILSKFDKTIKYSSPMDYFGMFFSIFIVYFHKYLMSKNLFVEFQIIQHLAIFPMLFYLLKVSRHKFITDRIMTTRLIAPFISAIANISLEIYIVHTSIRPLFEKLEFIFPINVMVFVTTSVLFAVIVKRVSNKITAIAR